MVQVFANEPNANSVTENVAGTNLVACGANIKVSTPEACNYVTLDKDSNLVFSSISNEAEGSVRIDSKVQNKVQEGVKEYQEGFYFGYRNAFNAALKGESEPFASINSNMISNVGLEYKVGQALGIKQGYAAGLAFQKTSGQRP